MFTSYRFHSCNQVFNVYLISFSELFYEHSLIDVAHTEFSKHLSQVRQLNEFFFISATFNAPTGLKPRSKNPFIPEQLGTNKRQNFLVSLLECCICSSQMMQPRIEVHNSLILLIEGQESGKSLNLLRSNVGSIQRLHSATEVLLVDLLGKPLIVHGHIDALLLLLSLQLSLLLLLVLLLLGSFCGLPSWFFGIFFLLFGEDDAEIKAFINKGCFDV